MPMLTNFIIRTKGNDKKRLIELIENNENLEGYGSKDLSNDICEIYGSCYKMINNALAITNYANFPVIIVDAHSENLVSYYQSKGFKPFKDKGLRLFLPMSEIIKTFNKIKAN